MTDLNNDLARRFECAVESATVVPFREVQLLDWQMQRNKCHENAAAYVREHPAYRVVKGWLLVNEGWVTKHSVVAGPDKELFDVTPLDFKNLRFFRHPGSDDEYQGLRADGPLPKGS